MQAERHFHLSPNLIQEPTGTTLHSELKSYISFMQEQGFFITYLITIIYMRVGPVQQLLLSTLLQWVTGLCKDCLCKTGLFSHKIQYLCSLRSILPLKRAQILPLRFKSRDSSVWNSCSSCKQASLSWSPYDWDILLARPTSLLSHLSTLCVNYCAGSGYQQMRWAFKEAFFKVRCSRCAQGRQLSRKRREMWLQIQSLKVPCAFRG